MRCLYCSEAGTSIEAAAICTTCGAAVCTEHVMRTIAIPGIMTPFGGGSFAARGPLSCYHCTGRLAVPAARAGGTSTRTVGERSRGVRLRWSPRRAPRTTRLTAADAHAAVAAAERLVQPASGMPLTQTHGRRGPWQCWRTLTRRLAASLASMRSSGPAD